MRKPGRRRRFSIPPLLAPALAGLLGAAAAPAAGLAADDPLRLGRDVVPVSQEVRLALDARGTTYTGSVRVALKVERPTASFRFHAEEMEITRLELTGPRGSVALAHLPGEIGLVTATSPAPLAPGDYTLAIDFANGFDTRAVGLYRMEQDGAGYLFTQFEAEDARTAFPCWDEPGFKLPFQLTLVVPEAHTAVTNTPLERESVEAGRRTMVFAPTPPLPSYLVAIAAGPLELVPIPGLSVPGRIVTVGGRSRLAGLAAEMTPPLLAALEAYFGGPYPFAKLDLIAVPEFWPGAMENPGAITYAESILLAEPGQASPARRRSLARITAHELAHMWFGDLVTMAWWDDLWLNESFADWLADKVTAAVHPEWKLDLSERQDVQATMLSDSLPSAQAIRRPVRAADNKLENAGLAYEKGKAVLGMFERWMGEADFQRAVRRYLAAHAWGNARAADLWRALSEEEGGDVGAAMATFLEQPGLPLVRVEVLPGGGIRLAQERFLSGGAPASGGRWQIPVALRLAEAGAVRTETVLLKGTAQTLSAGAARPDWVFPDAGAAGYYRWSVPREMLLALTREAPRALSPRERVGLLGNLAALLQAGELGGDAYLEALGRFAGDPEPQVIATALEELEEAGETLVPEGQSEAFAAFLRSALRPALDRFGFEPKTGEEEVVALVRPRLLTLLGEAGRDEAVLAQAEAWTRRLLADRASVDPALQEVALELAATRGDRRLWEELRKRFEAAPTPAERSRYLSALGSFRDPELVEASLAYSLSGPLRNRELSRLVREVGATAPDRDRRFRFLTANYGAIVARLPPEFAAFLPSLAGGCEPERVAAARAFFADPARDSPATRTSLDELSEQVDECVRLRKREAERVAAFLAGLGTGS